MNSKSFDLDIEGNISNSDDSGAASAADLDCDCNRNHALSRITPFTSTDFHDTKVSFPFGVQNCSIFYEFILFVFSHPFSIQLFKVIVSLEWNLAKDDSS